MSDRADSRREVAGAVPAGDRDPIEAYETEGTVVLYDSRNPLAWIESTDAVRIDEAV